MARMAGGTKGGGGGGGRERGLANTSVLLPSSLKPLSAQNSAIQALVTEPHAKS